ncbi:MAG: pilus assembly PilX N-terminal domain-containing protein [Burkholderiaceae bacterium]|nr:pilus assembly PilX N-terminal domain-containing protein [Burkholderiaceae bacterium]
MVPCSPRHQRGVALLVIVMLMLFIISIAVFYLNRGLLFEQKTSANQWRSTLAQETAEAGVEWATGMLNASYNINTSCVAATTPSTLTSFRRKYVFTGWNAGTSTDVLPAANVLPGCKVNGNTLTCSCPDVPSTATTAIANLAGTTPASQPSFTVQFSKVQIGTDGSGNPVYSTEAVRVISTGCTAQDGACTPGATAAADSWATVSSVIKLHPVLRGVPASALTCGLSCNVGGSFNIVNADVATGGSLINAGTTITTAPGTSLTTIPGQPASAANIPGDTSLANLSSSDPTCTKSAVFSAYFGSTIEEYVASSTTTTISCTNASDCGSQINAAYAASYRSFYFPLGLTLNNSSDVNPLGSANDAVSLVSPSGIDINGNISIYGMLFSNSSQFDDLGTGSANVYGAMVSCGGFTSNGNGTVAYTPLALASVRRSTAKLVRVPGSWTDRCSLSTPLPTSTTAQPTIQCN